MKERLTTKSREAIFYLVCLRVLTGVYFVFITLLCFLSVAMTIVVVHLYTNSVAAIPPKVPAIVSSIDFLILSRFLRF